MEKRNASDCNHVKNANYSHNEKKYINNLLTCYFLHVKVTKLQQKEKNNQGNCEPQAFP